MNVIIGIDVGGSTTKIIGIEDGKIRSPQCITAADPVTSLFGAFGKYLYDNGISLSDVSRVMLTGVGSAYISGPLYGLPTERVDEFMANARGAGYRSGLDRMVVVSMGTGTSFVMVDGDSVTHLGGLAVGGGTLQGLSDLLLKTRDIRKVIALAMKGSARNVDLHIGDICRDELPGLPLEVTAANFGRADRTASPHSRGAGEHDIPDYRQLGEFHCTEYRCGGFRPDREHVPAPAVRLPVRPDSRAVQAQVPHTGAP